MPFEGWALPWSFRHDQEMVGVLKGEGFPPLEHLELPGERLDVLLEVLRRAGPTLVDTPVSGVLFAIDTVARRFLDPGDELRKEALEALAAFGGFSGPMAEEILDGMARGWTRPPLVALLHAEFRNPEVLDGFQPSRSRGEVRALGFPLSFHLGAGTIPGVATTSMIRSLLVKSAVLLRPGRGDVPLSVLFARGLQEVDPELGQAVAVVYWPTAQGEVTERVLDHADQVIVYGSDETVSWVRIRTPPTAEFVGYRHRLGVGLIGRKALRTEETRGDVSAGATGGLGAREVALAAARAVALFDQRGCVSPHIFFVEKGGETAPGDWAEMLAGALEGLEQDLPSGPISAETGAALQQVRGAAEMEEASGRGRVFHGGAEAPWTVLVEADGALEPTCMNRTVRVVPVAALSEALDRLSSLHRHLQTVGVAGLGDGRKGILERLVRLGVSRVVGLEGVPWPPAWWHHDGSGPLRSLVRWTDIEGV